MAALVHQVKRSRRYRTSHLLEDQFEPGSRGLVLKNLPAIKRKREMDRVEGIEYARTLSDATKMYGQHHRFKAEDIRKLHKLWLGEELEQGPPVRFTPCYFKEEGKVVEALAAVHAELVLVHPFREGNGRIARLLSFIMALQAGLPPLNFGNIQGRVKKAYFSAVQIALSGNYKPMEEVFSAVISRTRRLSADH